MQERLYSGGQGSDTIDLSNFRVLIVDDNQDMRNIIRPLLRRLRVSKVSESESGTEALEKLVNFHFNLIIASMNMGDMNGIDFVRKVRADSDLLNQNVAIIMISALTKAESVVEARDAGINEFIAIPVSYKVLRDRVINVACNPRPFLESKPFNGPDRRRHDRDPVG